jgi:GGDEF domain-containing protein
VVARLGGEEFGLLLPETDRTEAATLAKRLGSALKSLWIGCRRNGGAIGRSTGILRSA